MFVIEPGTIVEFADGKLMSVNNDGTLISAGVPDNPIIYTSDSSNPGYGDYYCPIFIEETASACTKVTYSYIEYAYVGILLLNKRLNSNIENNYFAYNAYGIVEYGTEHTYITNNLVYGSYCSGIEVFLESTTGQADANSHILLENNTCDYYQDYGITVHGVEDANNVGLVVLSNNIVSGAYQYGLNLVDWYMNAIITNTGYFDNASNKNWEFDETNPVVLNQNPYETGSGFMPICYIDQDCNFIDTGYQYTEETELIGKTTATDGTPDSNVIDIGFHYPNWNFSNAGTTTLTADFNNDYTVNFNDLSSFIDYWLFDYQENYSIWYWDFNNDDIIDFEDLVVIADYWLGYFNFNSFASFAEQWEKQVDERFFNDKPDLNNDGFVNFKDFRLLAQEWKQIGDADPNIEIRIYGNSENGCLNVGISGSDYDTTQAFIFIDGEFIGEIEDFDEGGYLSIDSISFRNGSHSLKAVVVDANDHITLSDNVIVDFNNILNCMTVYVDFEQNEPFKISGIYSGTNDLLIKLVDWNNSIVWSQQISGNPNLIIPGAVFNGQIYDLVIEEHTGGTRAETWEEIWKKAIGKKYETKSSYKFAIFLPSVWALWGNSADCRKEAVAEIIRRCESRGIEYIVLYKNQCNWENFASVLSSPNISYVYMVSHGSANISEGGKTVQRTNFSLSGKYFFSSKHSVVSYKKSDYGNPNNVPSSYEELPGKWEISKRVHSMRSLGLGLTNQIRIAHLDICSQAKYTDMARYWIDFEEVPILDQLFVSWNSVIGMLDDDWQKWSYDIWNQLGDGGTTYWQAQDYTSKHNDKGSFIRSKVRYYGYDQVTFTKQGN